MRQLIIYAFGLLLGSSCEQAENKTLSRIEQNESTLHTTTQPSDSLLLLQHLDSLPKTEFPFLSEFYNRNFTTIIDLSAFKNKQLFNLPFKRLPRGTATGSIDYEEDSTFDLTDDNFRATWNLIAKTPRFIVIEVYTGYAFLVTITYDLKLIDAIRTGYADPAGNVHWHANRHTIINKDLTLILQHESELQVDDNKYETETVEEKWLIDAEGRFKQK